MKDNIAGGASNSANLITGTSGSIGRVEVYWRYPAFGENNAGISSIDSPTSFCPGTEDIWVTVRNEGINQLDSVKINWTLNGTPNSLWYTSLLDTARGSGSASATIKLGSHNFTSKTILNVWTSDPNGVQDTVNENDTQKVTLAPSIAGNFTIGGTGADYLTISDAVNDLNSYGVCGPVHFKVAPGTYNERLVINSIGGASSTNTITFEGSGSSGSNKSAITHSSTTSEERATVMLDGADYVTFDSFEINADGSSYGIIVHLMNQADHNTIKNCVLNTNTSSTSSNFSGLVGSASATSPTSSGNNGNYNTFFNNTINGGYYGISFRGSGTTSPVFGNTFASNNIINSYYYGAYTYYQDSITFIDNRISGVRNSSAGDGYFSYYSSDFLISRNIIEAPDYGLYVYYGNSNNYTGPGNSEVSNNIVYSSADYALRSYYTENTNYYNNTIYSGTGYAGYFYNGSSQDVRNNIFISASSDYAFYWYNTTFDYLDHNVYFTTSGNLIYDNGTVYSSLANWQANVTQFNQNSIQKEPEFVNRPSNLHLKSTVPSPRGTGVGVVVDVDGDPRCTFAPTIGGDESEFIVPPPVASFSVTDTVCFNSPEIVLNAASINEEKMHEWFINGRFVSNELNLNYTFDTAGITEIMLVTQNCSGIDTFTQNVVVDSPDVAPVSQFIADRNVVDRFETVKLTDLSFNCPSSWSWDISPKWYYDASIGFSSPTFQYTNGTDSTSQNPEILIIGTEKLTVCLTASNSQGQGNTECKQAYINVRESADMCSAPVTSDFSFGILYDEGGRGFDYSNNSNCNFLINPCADSIKLTFSEFDIRTGDYLRIYEGTDNTGTPLWDVNYFGSAGIGNNVDMTNPGFKQTIMAGSGPVYIEFTSNASTTGPGFALSWEAFGGNFPAPVASFNAPDTICAGIPVQIENTSQGANNEYIWFSGQSSSSEGSTEDITLLYPSAGVYTITLVAENCGGFDTAQKQVVVYAPSSITADFEASSRKAVKDEDIVTLNDNSFPCANVWEWTFTPNDVTFMNGTDRFSQNPQVIFNAADTYDVKLKVFTPGSAVDSITKTDHIVVIDFCRPSVATLNSDLGISRVKVGTINNRTASADQGYTNYSNTHQSFLSKGEAFEIMVERPTANNQINWAVWIDYNFDGDFEDVGELVAFENSSSLLVWRDTFTVPLSAANGATKMRVATNFGGKTMRPCGPHDFGEFEDYRVIITPDIVKPVIVLNNPDTLFLEACDNLSNRDLGATATDNVDGNMTSQIVVTSNVDTAVPGTYYIRYNITDNSGNQADEQVRVVVITPDAVDPVLTLLGNNPDTLEVHTSYNDPGFTASDACAGLSGVTIVNTLDTSELGIQTITYTATDSAGNTTTRIRQVIVVDTEAPVISLNGSDTIRVEVFSSFTDPGVVVNDNFYSDNELDITVTGTVNTSVVGVYQLTYSVTDPSGNGPASVTRTVIVQDTEAPQVSSPDEGDTFIVEVFDRFIQPQIMVKDNYYSNVSNSVQRTGSFYKAFPNGETKILGTYTATYIYTDGSGNSDSISFIVRVVDTEAPVIDLGGPQFITILRWREVDTSIIEVTDNYDKNPAVTFSGSYFTDYLVDYEIGFYNIEILAEDGSGNVSSTTIVVKVDPNTGIESLDNPTVVELYPNPVKDKFNLSLKFNQSTKTQITLLNSQGKELSQIEDGTISGGSYEVDMRNYSSGLYFVRIISNNNIIMKKLILSK